MFNCTPRSSHGERITYSDHVYILMSDVPAKHKFGTQNLSAGDDVVMYGVFVGKARHPIQAGEVQTSRNVQHEALRYSESSRRYKWILSRRVSVVAASLPRIPHARWAGWHAKLLVQWCRWFSERNRVSLNRTSIGNK